jgi:AcrR family transcriptional regulator
MPDPYSKHERILQATWRLIRHYGLAKTTIRDIAREAGIGKGTVYLYFGSKAEIMLALVDRTNERITEDLERIARSSAPAEARLRECLLHRVLTIFDLVHRYPHGEEVISRMKPEIVRRIDRYVRRQGEILGGIINEGCGTGELETRDPAGTGLTLANLFELLTPPYYRLGTRKQLERFAEELLDLLVCGIRKHGKTGSEGDLLGEKKG